MYKKNPLIKKVLNNRECFINQFMYAIDVNEIVIFKIYGKQFIDKKELIKYLKYMLKINDKYLKNNTRPKEECIGFELGIKAVINNINSFKKAWKEVK
jgi:hypothetical protein